MQITLTISLCMQLLDLCMQMSIWGQILTWLQSSYTDIYLLQNYSMVFLQTTLHSWQYYRCSNRFALKSWPFAFLVKALSDSNDKPGFYNFFKSYILNLLFLPMSSAPSINLTMPYNLQPERKGGQQLAFSKWWHVSVRALGGPIYQTDF